MTRLVVTSILLIVASAIAVAHPLPDSRYDRRLDVRLRPQMVEVRYELELSPGTISAEFRKLFAQQKVDAIGTKPRDLSMRYGEKLAPILAAGLDARLDGQQLQFRVAKSEVIPDREHTRFRYVFEAPWAVEAGGPEYAFTLEDSNFAAESGIVWLTLKADEPVLTVRELIEPEDLRGRHPSEYKPGDAERARRASARFLVPIPGPVTAEADSAQRTVHQLVIAGILGVVAVLVLGRIVRALANARRKGQ